jgi:hypothetical protein
LAAGVLATTGDLTGKDFLAAAGAPVAFFTDFAALDLVGAVRATGLVVRAFACTLFF